MDATGTIQSLSGSGTVDLAGGIVLSAEMPSIMR